MRSGLGSGALAFNVLLMAGCHAGPTTPTGLSATSTCAEYNDADNNARARVVRKLLAHGGDPQAVDAGAVANALGTASYECGTNPDFVLGRFGFATSGTAQQSTPPGESSDSSSSDPAPSANEVAHVTSAVQAVFSYDYRTLSKDRARGLESTSGAFQKEYVKTMGTLAGSVAQNHAVVVASVAGLGLMTRSGSSPRYLVFVDQQSTSTLTPTPKITQSVLQVTVDASDKVNAVVAGDTGDPSKNTALEAEVARLFAPLQTLSYDNADQVIRTIEAGATGDYLRQFTAAAAQLKMVVLQRHTVSRLSGDPAVGIVSTSPGEVVALISDARTVRDSSNADGAVSHDRWKVTLQGQPGKLKVSELEPVS